MKHIGTYAGALMVLGLPVILFAEGSNSSGTVQALIGFEEQSKILEMLSLWSVLTISFATSAMVWLGGRQMQGGVFGKVINLFSIGMTFIFLSAVAQIPWLQDFSLLYMKMLHDLLFIVGFVFMGIAASKLLQVIKGE